MKKIYIILFLTGLVSISAGAQENSAQEINCTQRLRAARAIYEQGRLQELPTSLGNCLTTGFTKAEKVEAYRLLVLTYIYLEEPEQADKAMTSLLETDHFFELNRAVDPVEFQNLYKKFRTKPIFSYGAKFGANTSIYNVQKNYYIFGGSQGKGTYASTVGIQIGLLFEKALGNKFVFNPEIFYNSGGYIYTNSNISTSDGGGASTDQAEFTVSQSHMFVNALLQYRIGDPDPNKSRSLYKTLSPYIAIGPSAGTLLSSSIAGEIIVGSQQTMPSLDNKENYKPFTYGITLAAGIKYQIGAMYLTADVRYYRGFTNVVDTDNRKSLTPTNVTLQNFGFVNNDYSTDQMMFNVGLVIPYFNPKKTIK